MKMIYKMPCYLTVCSIVGFSLGASAAFAASIFLYIAYIINIAEYCNNAYYYECYKTYAYYYYIGIALDVIFVIFLVLSIVFSRLRRIHLLTSVTKAAVTAAAITTSANITSAVPIQPSCQTSSPYPASSIPTYGETPHNQTVPNQVQPIDSPVYL